MTGQDCQWCGRKWEQLPGSSGVEEGRRCAYLALYWPSRDGQVPGQRNRGVPGSDWLSENLVVCQECGFQLSSFLLEKKKKKKDAGDSGTSHQGPFPAKKGLRGRNHLCDSQHHCQVLPVNICTPALLVQVTWWRTDLNAEWQSLAPRWKPALRLPKWLFLFFSLILFKVVFFLFF